mgnify:CR=1 FL=1
MYKDILDEHRTTMYVAPEQFNDDAHNLPPYSSTRNYDAKLWQFVKKYGDNGDFIWNVA